MKIVPRPYDLSPVAGEHVAVELMVTYCLDLRYPIYPSNQTFACGSDVLQWGTDKVVSLLASEIYCYSTQYKGLLAFLGREEASADNMAHLSCKVCVLSPTKCNVVIRRYERNYAQNSTHISLHIRRHKEFAKTFTVKVFWYVKKLNVGYLNFVFKLPYMDVSAWMWRGFQRRVCHLWSFRNQICQICQSRVIIFLTTLF